MVKDLHKSIQFYTEVLGLPLKNKYGDNYAEIQAGNIDIGLHPADKSHSSEGIQLGISVGNFDHEVEALKEKGVLVQEKNDGWSRLATFKDIDGHILYLIENKDYL